MPALPVALHLSTRIPQTHMDIDVHTTQPLPYPASAQGGPSLADSPVERLAKLIAAYSPHDGMFEVALPGIRVARTSNSYQHWIHGVQSACLCIVAQGAKSFMLGEDVYECGTARMLVSTVEVPVTGRVTCASPAEAFLCFQLALDPARIAALTPRVFPRGLPKPAEIGAVEVSDTPPAILDAVTRLLQLIAQPDDIDLLAPLVVDEILIRLLRSPSGARIAQIGHADSASQRISKAVAWIRDNYLAPMTVEDLARQVDMSPSTFHHHFRSVTSMSPLQCQKVLRLQEARRLMLATSMDAGQACRCVGYVSASQFSREYARLFGDAPTRDVARLRGQTTTLARTAP